MALFAQILGWMLAVWETNPGLCSFILQVTLLVCAFLCISCSHSVRVHVYHSGEVSVDVDQSEPLEPQVLQAGLASWAQCHKAGRQVRQPGQSTLLLPFLSRMSQWILILPSRRFHVAPGQRLSLSHILGQQRYHKDPGQALSQGRLQQGIVHEW